MTSSGLLDNTFHNGLGVETYAFTGSNFATATGIGLQSNGEIIVSSGVSNDPSTGNDDFALIRLGANGGIDALFGTNGQVLTPFPNVNAFALALAIQSNDSIVLGGFTNPTGEVQVIDIDRRTGPLHDQRLPRHQLQFDRNRSQSLDRQPLDHSPGAAK